MATSALPRWSRLILTLNGHELKFEPEDAIRPILALAAGELADWFHAHLLRR